MRVVSKNTSNLIPVPENISNHSLLFWYKWGVSFLEILNGFSYAPCLILSNLLVEFFFIKPAHHQYLRLEIQAVITQYIGFVAVLVCGP